MPLIGQCYLRALFFETETVQDDWIRLPAEPPYPLRSHAWARWLLRRLGWRIDVSQLPPRGVMVVYPHTSNWDFPTGMLLVFALGWPLRWMGKKSLFRWPVGGLMRYWGGISVNRASPEGIVEEIAELFQRSERLHIAIAPEGTRGFVPHWKSGFLRIARAANVPLILCAIDYGTKTMGVRGVLTPSDDAEADMARIAEVYAGVQGKRPACAGAIRLRP